MYDYDCEIYRLHQRFVDYCTVFKSYTKDTQRWHRTYFRGIINHTGIKTLKEFTREFTEQMIFDGKMQLNWSAKTIKNKLQTLSLFADWLVDREYLKENFVKKIPKPKLPKALSKNDAEKLLDWAIHFPYTYKFDRTRGAAIIALFIFTGIRKQELLKLKLQDVDLSSATLFVNSGKGNKDRVIPLSIRAIRICEEYLKDRKRLKKTCPYFFTAMRQDTQMSEMVVKRLVHKLRTKCKIHFYPHVLRHTFATLMIEGGCDVYSLSKMMGHSDIKTTTIYLSTSTAHLRTEIDKHPLGF